MKLFKSFGKFNEITKRRNVKVSFFLLKFVYNNINILFIIYLNYDN